MSKLTFELLEAIQNGWKIEFKYLRNAYGEWTEFPNRFSKNTIILDIANSINYEYRVKSKEKILFRTYLYKDHDGQYGIGSVSSVNELKIFDDIMNDIQHNDRFVKWICDVTTVEVE